MHASTSLTGAANVNRGCASMVGVLVPDPVEPKSTPKNYFRCTCGWVGPGNKCARCLGGGTLARYIPLHTCVYP